MYISPGIIFNEARKAAKLGNRRQRQRFFSSLMQRSHALHGVVLDGVEGTLVEVQARATGIQKDEAKPAGECVKITGLESPKDIIERVSGALASLGVSELDVKVQVSLHPAELKKTGTSLDLPIAIVVLQAAGYLDVIVNPGDFLLFGELDLCGQVRSVSAALPLSLAAKDGHQLVVPTANTNEAMLIFATGRHNVCDIQPVSTLEEAIGFITGKVKLSQARPDDVQFRHATDKAPDFGLIRGQKQAKRAMVICAAGSHSLLMCGPPGNGKSFAASALPGIMPPLTKKETVELSAIYSSAGELKPGTAVTRRPFIKVHSTASKPAVVGGGSDGELKPGAVTRAHFGVLFLDELPQFNKAVLESLREPMEDDVVNISRTSTRAEFPCQFSLIAAMNPCPCGNYGYDDPQKGIKCECKKSQVENYYRKISGPIRDRIDMKISLNPLTPDEHFTKTPDELESPKMLKLVCRARMIQVERFAETDITCNARIPGGEVRKWCDFSDPGMDEYRSLVENLGLSSRGMDRLAKVARTIADLDNRVEIQPRHVTEAAEFVGA